MKSSRYTEAQIHSILRLAEVGLPMAQLCREHSMSNALFYIYGRLSLQGFCRADLAVFLGCECLPSVTGSCWSITYL